MTIEKGIEFGPFVRREREGQGLGLREMARRIGVSSSGLSMAERNLLSPPAEDKLHKLAKILDVDADELLALAGKVSSDLLGIILERPKELAALLRATKHMTVDDVIKRIPANDVTRRTRKAEKNQ